MFFVLPIICSYRLKPLSLGPHSLLTLPSLLVPPPNWKSLMTRQEKTIFLRCSSNLYILGYFSSFHIFRSWESRCDFLLIEEHQTRPIHKDDLIWIYTELRIQQPLTSCLPFLPDSSEEQSWHQRTGIQLKSLLDYPRHLFMTSLDEMPTALPWPVLMFPGY